MKEKLLKKYSIEELMNTNGSQLENSKELLSKKMQFYNSHPVTTTKDKIFANLNVAKDAIIENIETLMERNNKIDITVKKSENLLDFSKFISAIKGGINKREYERKIDML